MGAGWFRHWLQKRDIRAGKTRASECRSSPLRVLWMILLGPRETVYIVVVFLRRSEPLLQTTASEPLSSPLAPQCPRPRGLLPGCRPCGNCSSALRRWHTSARLASDRDNRLSYSAVWTERQTPRWTDLSGGWGRLTHGRATAFRAPHGPTCCHNVSSKHNCFFRNLSGWQLVYLNEHLVVVTCIQRHPWALTFNLPQLQFRQLGIDLALWITCIQKRV